MSSVPKSAAPAKPLRVALPAAPVTLCTWGLAPAVQAQSYPTHAVRIIVPYGPGTTPATLARFAADALSKRLRQPLVVENKAGAGGLLGTETAVAAAPDGYALFPDTSGAVVEPKRAGRVIWSDQRTGF